jgi:hypothetical protein
MPPRSEILPALYFSSQRDWNDLAAWYRSLLRGKIIMSDEMKKDLAALISPGDSDMEKVSKIYNHVTDAIRYVGFELGIGALQPRSTDQTYRTRMGDCKDIALVLTAMLREAGIDASIAMVKTRDRGTTNTSAPSLGEFNHAICYVNLEGGFFLDGTRDNCSFRELPSDDRDIEALMVNEKTQRFINTGSSIYDPNSEHGNHRTHPESRRLRHPQENLEKHGDSAASSRQDLGDSRKKEKSLNEYWNNLFAGSSVSDLEIVDSSRTNRFIPYNVQLKNFAAPERRRWSSIPSCALRVLPRLCHEQGT